MGKKNYLTLFAARQIHIQAKLKSKVLTLYIPENTFICEKDVS